jgi:peroxiredoxin
MSVIEAGTAAPAFKLGRAGDPFTEANLRDGVTCLIFYPFAFSPVCTHQLQLYEPLVKDLAGKGATLYGVSCDAVFSQSAFKDRLGVSIEQLSDFEPKGAACTAFGVYHPAGFPQRALIVTGPDGVVRWSYEAPSPGELPSLELLQEGLAAAGVR